MGWSLATEYYIPRLTDENCLWSPHPTAFTVRQTAPGVWVADATEPEPDEPWHVTVAWLTWHLQWWLTAALAEARSETVPERLDIRWAGTADGTRHELTRLAEEWQTMLVDAEAFDPNRPTRFPWPDARPLHRLLGWANIELMKNVAEIGIVLNLARRSLDATADD